MENESIYRPAHKEMTELYKNWEYRSAVFHQSIAKLDSDTSENTFNEVINEIPKEFQEEVRPIIFQYQQHLYIQKELIASGKLSELDDAEQEIAMEIKQTTNKIARNHAISAFVTTPISSAKELLLNSHLHQKIFQQFYRGNFLVEALRYLTIGIIVLSLLITLARSVIRFSDPAVWIMALGIAVTFVYLIYVQRLNEERYLYPLIPIALVIAICELSKALNGLSKK